MILYIRNKFVNEVTLRLILWVLFIYLDYLEPFSREIQPEEVWKYKYPLKESYVSSRNLWMIILTFPTILIVKEYLQNKDKIELYYTLLSLSLNYGLVGFWTQFLKLIVGRPRPNFFYKCFPDGEGSDFNHCTGFHRSYLDGRKSFPSGHSSFAFSSMFFITLYLAGKLKVFIEGGRGNTWRLCICCLPLVLATSIAVSRTCDYHHHYEDVVCGSLLGIVIAYVSYRQYFPSIYSSSTGVPYAAQSLGIES
ncbi:hypothetical protein PPYR_06328 [Photinus pyralis]|uniref:Phosphatidic acid phosphatase type 2/haloperoxidase domain-containing protein n=1 Tax=Photinus pyralis TaxID=7054 RepID=A0A5N4ATN7_PHOPY|nr:hypothetical protein PPYR_06328 [Photinus pyralis]